MIRQKTALRIASQWYDGDGSALYRVSCGRFEKMRPEDFLRASREIAYCIGTNKADNRDLCKLYQFLVARG